MVLDRLPRDQEDVAAGRADMAEVDDAGVRLAVSVNGPPRMKSSWHASSVEATKRPPVVTTPVGRPRSLRIDQVEAAGRGERTENRRRVAARDTVERRARAVIELDGVAVADREAMPVDHAASRRGRLMDGQDAAIAGADRALAPDERPPFGSGPAAWATGTHHGASASDTHTASGSARKRGFRKTRLEQRAKRVVRAADA